MRVEKIEAHNLVINVKCYFTENLNLILIVCMALKVLKADEHIHGGEGNCSSSPRQ